MQIQMCGPVEVKKDKELGKKIKNAWNANQTLGCQGINAGTDITCKYCCSWSLRLSTTFASFSDEMRRTSTFKPY
jgi:hypothetical protein